MPSRSEWSGLARETFDALDLDDVTELYRVEWQKAQEALLADHRGEIDAQRKRWKRELKKASAIVFGLARRLAPARRLLFAAVLVLEVFAYLWLLTSETWPRKAVWSFWFLSVAVLLLVLLLGMELVDKLQFRDELLLARDLQAQLVPRVLPETPSYEIAGFNRIANTVGGDLYDFVLLPDGRLVVLFGDASGHGMAAGLVMAVAHAAFRAQLPVDPSPEAVAGTLNRILCGVGGTSSFFAGITAVLEPSGAYRAVVAGHPPILKLDGAGRIVERIGTGAYPFGIKPTRSWTVLTGVLTPGEALLFHSDGLPEACDAAGRDFGDSRIEAVLARKPGAPAFILAGALAAELAEFLGRSAPEDDVSIAAVRKKSGLPA
jgi:phosphoserine phosphatase RsbU/P